MEEADETLFLLEPLVESETVKTSRVEALCNEASELRQFSLPFIKQQGPSLPPGPNLQISNFKLQIR
jgi:hypothetical protein